MTSTTAWNEESTVGPPSERIDLQSFITQSRQLNIDTLASDLRVNWHNTSSGIKSGLINELDLGKLRLKAEGILLSPRARRSFFDNHSATVRTILLQTPTEADEECITWARKTPVVEKDGRLAKQGPEPQSVQPTLKSWAIPGSAASFVGRPSAHFMNTLVDVNSSTISLLHNAPVLITASVYKSNVARWCPLVLQSRHVFASSQTLQDLIKAIDCSCRENVLEVDTRNTETLLKGWQTVAKEPSGHGICFAGLQQIKPSPSINDRMGWEPEPIWIFDRRNEEDHGSTGTFNGLESGHASPATDLDPSEMSFDTLLLQLHLPYIFLHEGGCQHPFTVDEVRLWRQEDGMFKLPATTFKSWTPRVTCKVCLKMPAAKSVTGDSQLGESPGLICDQCWISLHPQYLRDYGKEQTYRA